MKKFFAVVVSCLLTASLSGFCGMKKGPMHGEMQEKMQDKGMHEKCKGHEKCMKHDGIKSIMKYLMLKEELDLSDKQVQELKQINTDYMKDKNLKNAEVENLKLDLQNSLWQNPPNYSQARDKAKEMYDIKLKMKLSKIDSCEKGYNALTKKQQEKLPDLMQKGMKMHKEKMMKQKKMKKNK